MTWGPSAPIVLYKYWSRLMDLLDTKTDRELLQSLLAEAAKATNELACAQRDLQKAASRLNFILVLTHKLLDKKDHRYEDD